MPFWSGEKLKDEVDNCILSSYDADKGVDCAAYTLHVGPEIFVTPDQYHADPNKNTKRSLDHNEPFNIPSGMFSFLQTQEVVKVPNNCIAFISMKAKIKFKGLINVSGFHVDPGYEGRLIFSVYNAGPTPIMLKRGMPLFLIWYADLDRTSEEIKKVEPMLELPLDIVNQIHGQIFSPQAISDSVSDFKNDIRNEVHKIDKKVSSIITIVTLLAALVGSVAVYKFNHLLDERDNIIEKYNTLSNKKAVLSMKKNEESKLSETPSNTKSTDKGH